VIGCEDRLRNDLYCVEWGVKLYSNQPTSAADSEGRRAHYVFGVYVRACVCSGGSRRSCLGDEWSLGAVPPAEVQGAESLLRVWGKAKPPPSRSILCKRFREYQSVCQNLCIMYNIMSLKLRRRNHLSPSLQGCFCGMPLRGVKMSSKPSKWLFDIIGGRHER